MKCSSVFLSLLLSYFVAAQLLPGRQSSTNPTLPDPTTTTTTPSATPTTTTNAVTTTSTDTTSKPPTSTPLASSPPPSHTTSTDVPSLVPSLTTISGSEVTVTYTSSTQPTSSSAVPSSPPPSSDSGLGTGSIIGLSVAGGVALIGVVAFFVWKFTRKRFTDFDDNEAIKWPDLNNHGTGNVDSHPLPVKNTGRSGFDTGSEADLSLPNNYSTPDFNQNVAPDPYAVPPLPHLNPNQPYRDDPSVSGYYDPYRGPVPGTIENGVPSAPPEWRSEAIPMTQMGVPTTPGRNSPGPQQQQFPYDHGRRSPGPYAAYDAPYGPGVGGRISPGPQAAYNPGTVSPVGGRVSPGPQVAYNAGSVSPVPGHRTSP